MYMYMYMFIQKDTCAWVCVPERPVLITWLREQRSPNGTQPPLAWRTSLQDSLASSHGQIPLVLRAQRAKPWPVFGTAEKHKNCLWVSLFPRDLYPCSASPPHHCQAHSLYSQFHRVFWLTKLAWPRGNEAYFFVCFVQSCFCLSCPVTTEKMWLLDPVVSSHHPLKQPWITVLRWHGGTAGIQAQPQCGLTGFRCLFLYGP